MQQLKDDPFDQIRVSRYCQLIAKCIPIIFPLTQLRCLSIQAFKRIKFHSLKYFENIYILVVPPLNIILTADEIYRDLFLLPSN